MSEQANDFAEAARALLTELARARADAIDLAAALADLHAAALRLPEVATAAHPHPTPVIGLLPDLPFDLYWETLEPLHVYGGGDAGTGSLHDDLSDIRADLARGLALFEAGRVDEAVWQWLGRASGVRPARSARAPRAALTRDVRAALEGGQGFTFW